MHSINAVNNYLSLQGACCPGLPNRRAAKHFESIITSGYYASSDESPPASSRSTSWEAIVQRIVAAFRAVPPGRCCCHNANLSIQRLAYSAVIHRDLKTYIYWIEVHGNIVRERNSHKNTLARPNFDRKPFAWPPAMDQRPLNGHNRSNQGWAFLNRKRLHSASFGYIPQQTKHGTLHSDLKA